MAELIVSKELISHKQLPITNLRERGAITLYVAPLIVLMALAIGTLVTYEIWWLNQPTLPLDINTATVGQLTALAGVDEPIAKQIIDGRPYERKDELFQKKIIPQATYDKIEDQFVAKLQ
jgi:Helix-hairpin-helix motif